MKALAVAALVGASACAAPATLPQVRFRNQPAVTVVNDRRDVARPPRAGEPLLGEYYYEGYFRRRVSRALEVRGRPRALGVNALDEVPDSTWFQNRIGVRDLTPDEVRAGATVIGSPEAHAPFTIHSSKTAGRSLGYIATDARGEKFLLKFDGRGLPEIETAAEIIAGRLLWAAGYHVPETHIIYIRRDDLVIAPDATIKNVLGHKRRLTARDVNRGLRGVEVEPDGRIRVMASAMLAGKALGGHAGEGTRAGDPNDRIPHERRRELRGAYPLFAWLDHLDIKVHNSLDMWVADPASPDCHYVMHYFLDFGKSLGMMGTQSGDHRRGYVYMFDPLDVFESLITAGLQERPWEARRAPALRGVGLFDAHTFDPAGWIPAAPVYAPLLAADDFDRFWGARLVMRFTRDQIRAAVDAARLSDPRAAAYLVDTLVARQRATGRHWFLQVNPLDGFRLEGEGEAVALCFDDLLLRYQLSSLGDGTRYGVTVHDGDGRELARSGDRRASAGGRTCVALPAVAGGDGYTIVRITTVRPTFRGSTDVHLAREPGTPRLRIIGIWRP
jgi:hypothetical protein